MLQRHYSVHGLRVCVLGNCPTVLWRVHEVLGFFGVAPYMAAGDVDVVLRFSTFLHTVPLPSGPPTAEQDGIRAWNARDRVHLGCDGYAASLDLAKLTGVVVIPPDGASLRKDFVIYTLLLLMRRRGLFALHASGVSRFSTGCLFVGPSGSTKSTQTYNLVRQGWDYLGDDALLLRASPDGVVEALALRRDLRLDPTPFHAYQELGCERPAFPVGEHKLLVTMQERGPARWIDSCVPGLLVFAEIALVEDSRLAPIKPADALLALLTQSVVLMLDLYTLPHHIEALARLTRQARSCRLFAGRDLRTRPELVAELLAPAMESGWGSSQHHP